MQPDLQEVLRAAARVAYGGTSPLKNQLAQHLLRAMTDPHEPSTAGTIGVDRAASLCHVAPSALLPVLKSDASFTVKQSGSGNYLIGLNTAALLQKGRKSTKTGILVEELPTPVAYVDDLHPIRPGRPSCFHWERYGRCAYNKQCVFDHAAPRGSDNAPRSRQQTPSPQSFYQQDSYMQGSKGTGGFVEGGFASQFEEQPPSSPGWPSDPDAHASVLAVPAGQRVPSAAGEGGQEGWASAGAAGQQAVQVPAAVTAGMQQQQRSAGPSRPGAAVCQMFMIRGFCPHGERCVYDHPTRSGPSGTGAGAAVTASIPPTPQTQDIIAAPSPAASSRSQSPLPPYLHHSQQPRQQQQEEEEGETEVEQVQHETLQQPAKQQKQHKREFPSVGLNEEGYPMFRGAPNCAYYMGTGRCDFNVRCKFHHPPYALHPDCVAKGVMPTKFNVHLGASYGRLVSHLRRLWDYDSCDEARLKVWLAHHLLARENTGCSMFSATAAKAAVEVDCSEVSISAEKPQGAYSCTLKEADQVLQLLWKAQPDEDASKPMPYIGQLRDLLGGDPYFELGGGKGAAGVKLNVDNIKKLLNF